MGKVDRTSGELFINEVRSDLSKFKELIGYVPQEDIMLRELTVRENLLHSARIRAPRNWTESEIQDFVTSLLHTLKLENVSESIIGDNLVRGVSGGQRKRVNIGIEISAMPMALFLDEPTSGLDSTSSLNVAAMLKNISRLGMTTLAVIHQPRSEIYYELDDILLLVPGGAVAYLGPRIHIVDYFENLGFKFDSNKNPADILMDIVSEQMKPLPGYNILTATDLVHEWEFYKANGYHQNQKTTDEMIKAPKKRTSDGVKFAHISVDPSYRSSFISATASEIRQLEMNSDDEEEHQRRSHLALSEAQDQVAIEFSETRPMSMSQESIISRPTAVERDCTDTSEDLFDFMKSKLPSVSKSDKRDSTPFMIRTSTQGSVLPVLHRTLTRIMSVKKLASRKVQQASEEELLSVCNQRGASFIRQLQLCFSRSIIQQYRNVPDLVWEMAVASFAGIFVGISMLHLNGQLFSGIYVEPYSILSSHPFNDLVPQIGLTLGMAVCIAAAPSGVNVFGPEIVNYYREAASGHSRAAYFIAKTFAALPRIILGSLHMASIWYVLVKPQTSFLMIYLLMFFLFYGIYGVASIVSVLVRRENQAVLATLVGFFPINFGGFSPSLTDARTAIFNYSFIMDFSFARWGNELLYSEETTPFRGFYKIDEFQGVYGYTLDRVGIDILMMLLLGSVLRAISYFVMISVNRNKQR